LPCFVCFSAGQAGRFFLVVLANAGKQGQYDQRLFGTPTHHFYQLLPNPCGTLRQPKAGI
jgi:hypothetical protein